MAGESKTEKATDKKRRDERKKGNIFLSKDIITLVLLLGTFFALRLYFSHMYVGIKKYMLDCFGYAAERGDITNDTIARLGIEFAIAFAQIAMPLLIAACLLVIISTVFQTKLLFSGESLKPKLSRLSPLQGIKRIFSVRSIVEVVKGIIKIIILFVILYDFVKKHLIGFSRLLSTDIISSCVYILDSLIDMVISIGIAFAALSILDYFYQWWEYERQMKMTKEEVKEEYKQLEGDPKVKGKIKETQRKMAMSRMMQAVPTADVVIKNPTHFAVALKYDMDAGGAPVVVAKGQDELALRIIQVAEDHDVYVVENKPLARALYASVEINQEIPADYYGAIAEILVYIYRLKNKL